MLLFSTVLSIKDTMTHDAFIELAIKWNQGSKHLENVIPGMVWNGERNIRFGDDNLWMEVQEYRNKNIIAIRYEKIEEIGTIWDTDFVMDFNAMRMSVRLDRSYMEDAIEISTSFSTPAFIALLIDGGYVDSDGDLPVERRPLWIDNDNLSLLVDVINGDTSYRMPVVYISKTDDERYPVNVREVAKRLKGVAHVFVQEQSWTTSRLHRLCDKKNEYDGAIGIYYPNQAMGHEKILRHNYPGSGKRMTDKVVERVIQYSNVQRIDTLLTWQGVNNALLRDKYSSKRSELETTEYLRKQAEYTARLQTLEAVARVTNATQKAEAALKETETYKELFELSDKEMKEKDQKILEMQKQIKDLTKQNDSLSATIEGLWAKLNGMEKKPLLYLGAEDEFFPGEIKEFVLLAVKKELDNTESKTRRADTLGDVLRSNGGVTGLPEKKKQRIKNVLVGYKGMNSSVKGELTDLGLKVVREGNHYTLNYYGDARYHTTLAKTPSDTVHGGKNAAMDIIRDML